MALKPRQRPIFVIKDRAIGDTVLMTGPLRLLRKTYPHAQIHVLVRSPAGELLEGLPFVDRVISCGQPPRGLDRVAYWTRMLRRLREKRYGMVLNFHASFRTSLTARLMRGDLLIANNHSLRGRNWFSDMPVPGRGQVKSIIDRDLDVLRAAGIDAPLSDAMPELTVSVAEQVSAREELASAGRGAGKLVFLGIGGSRSTKRWPPEHFAALAARLAREFDARFVLASVAGDEEWMTRFNTLVATEPGLADRIHHLSGQRLRRVAALMSQCDAYVGNDSGLKHVAAALGLNSFTFFGPEDPLEWHPYERSRHALAYLENLPCRTETGKHWCPVQTCMKHEHRCMRELIPGKIWSEVSRIVTLDRERR